jgi:hypothetical protein
VPAAAHGDDQILLARELDRLDHIFGRIAAGDRRGPAVNHRIPDLAHLIVASAAWKEHVATEVRLELVDTCLSKLIHSCLLALTHWKPRECGIGHGPYTLNLNVRPPEHQACNDDRSGAV